jgi:membrane-associated phospholipid phosphatase
MKLNSIKGIWEIKWFSIPVALFFVVGLIYSATFPYGTEILWMNNWRTEPLNSVFHFFSALGEAPTWFIAGATALFWRYRFVLMIALAGLISPFVYVLKDKAAVDRPITYFYKKGMATEVVRVPDVDLNVGQTSFPSGHSMSAFGLYSLLALILYHKNNWILPLLLAFLAIMVGISRIFLVQHFLVDVLGGAFLGLLVSGFVWWLNRLDYFQQFKWLDKSLYPLEKTKSQA